MNAAAGTGVELGQRGLSVGGVQEKHTWRMVLLELGFAIQSALEGGCG